MSWSSGRVATSEYHVRATLISNVSFPVRKCCSAEDLRTFPYAPDITLGILIAKYLRRGHGSLYKCLVYATDFRTYIYVELMIHIITEDPVYIRLVDVQIFNSARVFTQTRCIVGITLCGCVWLFDKTIPLENSFYLYNPPIAQR